jgi:hypothetical protein
MTIVDWIQLVGAAVVGSVLTLLVQLVLQRTGHRQDMAAERWKESHSRHTAVLAAADVLYTHLKQGNPEQHVGEIEIALHDLWTSTPHFVRYPTVKDAIGVFNVWVGAVMDDEG